MLTMRLLMRINHMLRMLRLLPSHLRDDCDDEEESSEDDEDHEDDEMDIKADKEEEEEEHPAPADSIVVAPTAADQAPYAEETEPFETDESAATPSPHPAYRMTARISIPSPVPMPAWTDSEVVRLLAISSPPASPLSPWSLPLPQIPFPPLPSILSPPSPILSPAPPPSPIRSLGYRAAMIRLRDEAASTSSPPLQLPSASRREDRPEVTLPPRKRLDIALGPKYVVGESSSAAAARPAGEIVRDPEREVGYGITDSWDEIVETLQGAPVSTDTKLGGYVREFETRVRQDTDDIYMRLDDEQTERQLLAGQLNMLFRDRRAHAYTRHLMETEARMSKEAWVRATYASDLVHGEVMSLRTTVLEISELRTALQGQKQMAPRRTTRSTTDQETINATSVTNAQLQAMIDQGVTTALAAQDALRSTNGDDSHNSGTGTEGVASLSQWCERMEFVFHINNYAAENQVKFATCTLHSVALTWKLEMELWDLKVKGTDLASYTQRFQELALLCGRMFFEESDKIEKYVGGLPDMIHGSLVASKPKTMQEAIEIATELMDKKIRTFAERHAGTDPDANIVTGTFLLNNRYASVLFDTGADRSFVSTTFSTQINITPSTLDHCYDVELADGRIIGLNTIFSGCTLNLLNHPFNIELMPIELGSFDAIIGMDWLAKYQAVIVCAKKIVCIPWGKETLIIHGNGSNQGNVTRLSIILCAKTEKYVKKGFPIFLAHISTKEVEDKSEKKRLEDVPIVQNFPEVFPEEFLGLPSTRLVEFQIDLVPGAAPVARALYRLVPSEMKELAEQLKELSDKGFIRPSSSPWEAPVLFVKKED
nr:putative reverse transcriptase domain-containing protein [Tanacetum cinerariifolium]